MVSNARLDLPDPERPVTTMRRSRGNSSETFFRSWTRAPWMPMVVRGAAFGFGAVALPGIGCLIGMEERQFLHADVALGGQPRREMSFADKPPVGQVLAHRRHAFQAEVAAEVIVDFGGGARLPYFPQVLEHRSA